MKNIFFVIIWFVSYINVYGQRTCASELNLSELQQTEPSRYHKIMALENQIQSYMGNAVERGIPQSTIIIPVVVHVLYSNSSQNISDAQINSQIQVLNEDFRRLNADKINTPSAFASIAGDANIEFKLAKIDPNGNSTTGITRTSTSKTSFSNVSQDMKFASTGGHDAWNSKKYLNIWVCNFSNSGLLGYAQFPDELETKANTDGVVISYNYFGRDGSALSPFNKGRTATHEIGHWLNLRHIWGDDGYSGCHCNGSDGVDDTPNQSIAIGGCPSFPVTDCCTNLGNGIMFMNYMDYTNDACMNLFTEGQVVRMRALFDSETGVRREMLETAEYLTESCPTTYINNKTYPSKLYDIFGIRTFNINGCKIEIANTTIKSNATVNVQATESVILKPGFWAKSGSTVSIKVTQPSSSPSLSSAQIEIDENDINQLILLEQAVASQKNGNIDFIVYPNPNDGNFTVKITGNNTQTCTVEIFNISGSPMGKVDCNVGTVDINRNDLPAGIYYLKISTGNESVVKKLIIK